MKRILKSAIITATFVAAICLIASATQAQTVAPMPAPAMTPAAMLAPMPAVPTTGPVMAPEAASMTAPAASMVAPKPGSMTAAPAQEKPKEDKDAKKEKSAEDIAGLIFKILGSVASLVFSVLAGLGYMKWSKGERVKQILKYADMAFPAVEALVKKTDNKVDDKLVEFLKMISESLKKAGEPELTKDEETAAANVAAKKALAEKLNG
jgi:hypothetical protein